MYGNGNFLNSFMHANCGLLSENILPAVSVMDVDGTKIVAAFDCFQ